MYAGQNNKRIYGGVGVVSARGKEIGPIDQMIEAKAVLAPMSGVTDIPFRLICRKFGCRFAFTEMVDVSGIAYNNIKTLKYLDRIPGDEPLGAQIVGEDARKLLNAAEICEERGFPVIDINAGCPATKVTRGGKGAALLKDIPKLSRILKKIVKDLTIPLTLKMRSGWDDESLNYLEVAKAAEDAGVSAVCIHARTQAQMYRGRADHNITRELKDKIDIPLFASGNVFKAEDVKNVIDDTGCDGVFIARGALGKPWLFRNIEGLLSGKDVPPEPDIEELKSIIIEHFSLSSDFQGSFLALKRMYKHMTWYLKRFKGINEIMKEYLKLDNSDSLKTFVQRLELDKRNRLYLGS